MVATDRIAAATQIDPVTARTGTRPMLYAFRLRINQRNNVSTSTASLTSGQSKLTYGRIAATYDLSIAFAR